MSVADTAAALAKTNLAKAQQVQILMSKGLSLEEAEAAVATAAHTVATGAATGATFGLTGATLSLKAALNGLKVALMTNPITAIITLLLTLIPIIIKIVNAVKDSHKTVSEKLEDLNSQFTELSNKIKQISSDFQKLKSDSDSVIPRFAELVKGVNQFGENVSLTDDEYEEFLRLNNKIAEMFPELNLGMDSNGNAMLALSYSADTLTDSLYKLVEAQRQAAYSEIAETMPDVISNIQDTTKVYNDEIKNLGKAKNKWEDVYNDILNHSLPTNVGRYSTIDSGGQAALDFIKEAEALGMHGDIVYENQQNTNNGYVFSVQWDYDSLNLDYVNKLYAAKQEEFDKQINDYERRIKAKWQTINPVVNSWLQTDFLFNDLDDNMQLVAETMVSGLDFSSLGLTTQEEVQKYITDNILNPLFLAAPEVREAFANITDWREQLQKGEISTEQFSKNVKDTFDNLTNGMDSSKVETFKNAFVSGFNAIGIEGDNFDAVVDNIIKNWGVTNSVFNQTGGIENAISYVQSLTKNISSVQKILSGQSTGTSLSIEDFNSEELKDYTSALEYHNGVLQLNADKVSEIVNAKSEEAIATNDANKALAQSKYLENAAQIEKLRQKIKDKNYAEGESEASIRANIDALLSENSTLKNDCATYDLMTNSLREATNAYNNWLNSKNASQSGDMFDDTIDAINRINETLNDSESDFFGRIGRTDYQAAIDLIVPNNVDREDTENINAYLESVKDLFTFNDDGNYSGLNIAGFLKRAVEQGLMTVDESGTDYQIAGQKTMEDFAEGMGLSLPLVQAMFGELEEFGGNFSWADEANKTIGDLAVSANVAAEAIRSVNPDIEIKLDVSNLETTDEQLSALDSTIKKMQEIVEFSTDTSDVDNATAVIQYCIAQKQQLSEPAIMDVDVSKVSKTTAEAVSLVQEFQRACNDLELKQALGVDTSEAQAKVDELYSQISSSDNDAIIALKLDTTSVDTVKSSISELSIEDIEAKLQIDDTALLSYTPEDKEATVKYNVDSSKVDAYNPKNLSRTVTYYTRTVGSVNVNGTAHVSGTANASGDWGTAKGGSTLTGELGREIVVDPHTGKWYTVGDTGAEFVNIPQGAIVFNHKQTESLLKNGYVAGRASALVGGTAMVTGGINLGNIPGYTPPSNNNNNNNSNSSSSSSNSSSSSKSNDKEPEAFDWIEVAIDRIERAIDRLKNTATSAYKALKTKLGATASEITAVNQELAIQEQAYTRYLQQANSVGLSSNLAEKVRNGTIDINEYDEDTKKLIDDYKQWYEKALDCADAIDELHENLASLYEDNFNNIKDDFDNQLELYEHLSNTYETGLDKLEAKGMLESTKYYAALSNVEKQNIGILNNELASLTKSFSEAMASGEIEEGSEAWYSMQQNINETKEAIDEANLSLLEYAKTMREIEWGYFDYTQERISQLTAESDFLINLMSNSKLYDDKGQLTDEGLSTMGLHGMNYNVYMAQADDYAKEILKLDEEIANDPYNTDLIKRREELLGLQRDSILAAEDEKQAIVSMVEEGIQYELSALKELIDAYTESLDSAKSLYDYQKKIEQKTQNVASLQKQLSAYGNDVSEETRAKVQKLTVELKEAEEDLQKTEYEQFISDTKKLLNDLYDEYEEILNQRLDDVDALIGDMIDTVNTNSGTINTTISETADNVGYTLTTEMSTIWGQAVNSMDGVIAKYDKDYSSQLTSVNSVLGTISANVAAMIEESNQEAEQTVDNTTATTTPQNNSETSNQPSTPSTPSTPSAQSTPTRTDKDNYGVALAIINGNYGWGNGSTRKKNLEAKGFNYNTVQGIINKLMNEGYVNSGAWVGRYYGIKDLSPFHYNKYLHGGLIDYTGLAQVDGTPGKPELMLNAEDTENFIKLRDVLRAMSLQTLTMGSSFGFEAPSLIGLNDVSSRLASLRGGVANGGTTVGDITITIPIDHVDDYNDFIKKLQKDKQFEQFVQSMTIDRLAGGSPLAKNKFKW